MRQQQQGPIHVFFGCRDDRDYLFREELQSFQCVSSPTDVSTASNPSSRTNSTSDLSSMNPHTYAYSPPIISPPTWLPPTHFANSTPPLTSTLSSGSTISNGSSSAKGVLTQLEVAFSRVGPEKVYVTHKLRANGAHIARLLLHECAHLYVCGDGNTMAKDVGTCVVELLMQHEGLTQAQAEEEIKEMKARKRYVLDIWS